MDLALPVKLVDICGGAKGEEWFVVINQAYQALFATCGLDSFQAIYDLGGGTVVKHQADRSVLRFALAESVLYLKRHERETRLKGGKLAGTSYRWCSEGGKEFAFFHAFRAHGLATANPVAMGERFLADGRVESFFITEDFAPFVQLEELIRHTPEVLLGEKNKMKRLNILKAVGTYARRMHQSGFNHQDFNATHVLLHGFEAGVPDMALFDLQRVDQRSWQKIRWPIKALAEFNYSSRENQVFSNAERLFLFHVYCDKVDQPLSLFEKIQYQWTCAKTERIARHTAKRQARNRKRRINSSLR